MIQAVILTFIITALAMLVLFLLDGSNKQLAENRRLIKENMGLRRQIAEYCNQDQYRRERSAYHHGLYNGGWKEGEENE